MIYYIMLFKKALLQIFMIFFLSCPALCADNIHDVHKKVVDIVKKYNKILVDVYKKRDMSLLDKVATEEQINKIDPIITSLILNNSIMIAKQKKFIVEDVVATEVEAEVKTEELWIYWWQDKDTGQIVRPKNEIIYKLRYTLVLTDNQWKVNKLTDR